MDFLDRYTLSLKYANGGEYLRQGQRRAAGYGSSTGMNAILLQRKVLKITKRLMFPMRVELK